MHIPIWDLDESKILTRRELAAVLAVMPRTANQRRNRIIVRLACCCGLRVSEIAALRMDDVVIGATRPHLRLRRETTKGKRPRNIALWWDAGTLTDLTAWRAERIKQGARDLDPFVCSVQANRLGESIQRAAIRRRFLSACKVLGQERVRTLTIHHGRHTFISHALVGGRTLANVPSKDHPGIRLFRLRRGC
jgi:integrase